MASYQTNNPSSGKSPIEQIRNQIKKNGNDALDKVNQLIDWDTLVNPLEDVIKNSLIGTSKPYRVKLIVKCFIIQMIYGYSDYQLSKEINDRRSFQNFLNLQFGDTLPEAGDIAKYRELLIKEGLYKKLFNAFYNQLVSANFFTDDSEDIEKVSTTETDKPKELSEDEERDRRLEEKLKELENLTKKLIDEKQEEKKDEKIEDLPVVQREMLESHEVSLDEKLKKIDEELKGIYDSPSKSEDEADKIFDKLHEIDKKLKDIYEKSGEEKVKEEIIKIETPTEETIIKEKITERPEEKIYEKEEHSIKSESTVGTTGKKTDLPVVVEKKEETTEEAEPKRTKIRIKRSLPIFNETNLTEDYELGLRFYKMGVRTSFVNLQTDEKNPESMIATGEYFPNDFWGAVRQRSRWIAGISYQNWSLHKWAGNFKTKYFLFRDRKTVLSSIVTFFSYFLFTYFLVYLVFLAFGYDILVPLVYKDSLLWYLLIGCFVFMVVRIFHRFYFTYKWYGFRYAFFSIIRLVFDNIINFFATIRAIGVYNKAKKKFAWESTSHY